MMRYLLLLDFLGNFGLTFCRFLTLLWSQRPVVSNTRRAFETSLKLLPSTSNSKSQSPGLKHLPSTSSTYVYTTKAHAHIHTHVYRTHILCMCVCVYFVMITVEVEGRCLRLVSYVCRVFESFTK